MNDPQFDEPTLGVVVGNDFYFVARSQWRAFDEKAGLFPAEKLTEPTILKVALRP